MEVQDRYRALVQSVARKTIQQPPPSLRRTGPCPGNDQPLANVPRQAETELSLLHLLDLRRRYRDESAAMRHRLLALQVALEEGSRQLCYQLTAGRVAPGKLRERCDELVEAVEAAERDLADAHLAIEGIGQEIALLVAARVSPR